MSEKLKVQVQDENGNIFYIHTSADIVFCEDGTSVETRLGQKIDSANIVQNATTAAADKIPSAAVAKNLQDQISGLNTNIVIHTYTAHFSGGNATVLRIKNGLQVISVQNYLGEMSNATIIRYWVYKDEGNDWIKIYIDQNYTGNMGVKIVGCMSCSVEPL